MAGRSYFGVAAILAFAWFNGVDAFWRVNCAKIQTGRVDPLVNFGALAAHAHTIVGGSNIGVNTTYESLVNSSCTSCEISGDNSAYWSPMLYYQYPNGSFLEVPHSGSVIYYLGRGPNAANIIPFPPGLNILSGDKAARSYDNQTYTWGNATYPGRPVADRVQFACLDLEPMAEQPYMFRTECVYGMRAQVHFQSCWNGKDLYKADNSHMAYQSSIDNGVCPPGYPYQVPQLFLETDWGVTDVPNRTADGRFVFSQGDPTGYGFHADFMNGWKEDTLENAVKNCLSTDNNGQISSCPALLAEQSDGFPFNCPERPPQVSEQVTGLLTKLPGCVNITFGPAAAPAASMNCPPTVRLAAISSTVDSTPLPTVLPIYGQPYGLQNQTYLGCFNDSAGGIRTLNSFSTSNYSVMSVEWCQAYCKTNGYRLSGVEYAQECHCDNALNPTASNVTTGPDGNRCTWNCGGTMTTGGQQEICGGAGHISVYNNTDPNFNATGSNANSAGQVAVYAPLKNYSSNYLGCTTDNAGNLGRALTGATVQFNNMTVENCAAYCAAASPNGYQYYGVEYVSQCYCGNVIATPNFIMNLTSSPANSTCAFRCAGDGGQMCGGPDALSLYYNDAYVSPKTKSPIGKYVTKGCLTDPQGAAARALQGPSTTNRNMTEDVCVKYCLGQKQHYAGIEYGQECYCGNSIPSASGGKQLACTLANLTLCPGNSLEYCGGPLLMSLFYSATL